MKLIHLYGKSMKTLYYLWKGVDVIKIHIIQQNDSLQEIIAKYGISKKEVKEANPHLADIEALLPGMKITIPSTSKLVPSTSSEITNKRQATEQLNQKFIDSSAKKIHVIYYAQPHRRPMGKVLALDEHVVERPLLNHTSKSKFPMVRGICNHCHQPIHSLSDHD